MSSRFCQGVLYFLLIVSVLADGEEATTQANTEIAPSNSSQLTTPAPILQKDAVSTTHEPELGLHGIIEQQLNLRFYNFICSKHYHLDCKITETLQICKKGDYVAVQGLPLKFVSGSEEVRKLNTWITTCDRNDQELNRETMKIIRKQIRIQNENDWNNVFNTARQTSLLLAVVSIFLWL